ncbi:hypothetical protein [Bacillus sp. T3]|uniref:hypothetical protein n=1 Tax=Bacillus sp. T3 TaxID=467262 RepID=UPI002981A45A|nr:hypothetical protein [Bacillus sp. T3]
MKELIATLYEITLAMNKEFERENYEELDKLLIKRNNIMDKVDQIKSEDSTFRYSNETTTMLEKIAIMNHDLTTKLTVNLEHTKFLINQRKINKQVSKKFQPYSNQSSGIFVDAKK